MALSRARFARDRCGQIQGPPRPLPGDPMRLVFVTYLLLVVLGLGYFLALGLLNR